MKTNSSPALLLAGIVLTALVAVPANAQTITVTDWTANGGGSSDFGSFSVSSSGYPAEVVTDTITITGLTVDGDGTANDSLSFDVVITASAPAGAPKVVQSPAAGTSWGADSTGDASLLIEAQERAGGETLTFVPGPVTVTLSGGGTQTGSFIAFTGVNIATWQKFPTSASFGPGTTFTSGGNKFLTGLTDPTQLTVTVTDTISPPQGRIRFTGLAFQVSTDPIAADIEIENLTVTDISESGATLGGQITGGIGITDYGTDFYTTPGATLPTANSLGEGAAPASIPATFTQVRTGMNPGTVYYFKPWAQIGANPVVGSVDEGDFLTEPLQVTIDSIAYTPETTPGDGDAELTINLTEDASAAGTLVVVRKSFPVSAGPEDDLLYTADTVFGSGTADALGGGQVVLAGSASSVTVTGLSDLHTYHVSAFAYAEDVGLALTNYQQDAPATDSTFGREVVITNFDPQLAAFASHGNLTTTLTTGTLGVDPVLVYTCEILDADLDGEGDAPDTITWTMTVTAESTGGNPVVAGSPAPGMDFFVVQSDIGDDLINAGETLKITPGTVTYTIDGGAAQTGYFIGFDVAYINNVKTTAGQQWTWDGGTTVVTSGRINADFTLGEPSELEFEFLNGTEGTNDRRIRVQNIDFRVSTVEPLISLGNLTATNISTDQADLGARFLNGLNVTAVGSNVPGLVPSTETTMTGGPWGKGDTFSITRTGLSPATFYDFQAVAENSYYGEILSTGIGSFLTEPNQATGLSLSTPGGPGTLTIDWTDDPDSFGTLIVVQKEAAVDTGPVDNTIYNAGAEFGFGAALGGGFVVYDGFGDETVEVFGLTSGTYHVAIYSYADEGGLTNYQQDAPLIASSAVVGPILVDSLTVTDISTDGATLGATVQDGTGITEYGTEWYEPGFGPDNYLAIVGTPTPPEIFTQPRTGMSPGTLYSMQARATNPGEGIVYSLDEVDFLTEPLQASGLTLTPGADTLTIDWTAGPGSFGSLVVVQMDAPVDGLPEDDNYYFADPIFGDGEALGGGFVVYDGSGTNVVITGLPPGTYHVAVFAYADENVFTNYQQDAPAIASAATTTSGFATWITGFGLDPADQDFGDDPDGDGFDNGLEGLFGTNPGVATGGIAMVSVAGLVTTFEHPQADPALSDVTGSYQWSPDLVTWYASGDGPGGGPPTVTLVPNTVGTTTTVTATASVAMPELFLRVVATQD